MKKDFDVIKYEEIAAPMRKSIPLEVGGDFYKGVLLLSDALMALDVTMAESARINFLAIELWKIGVKEGREGKI